MAEDRLLIVKGDEVDELLRGREQEVMAAVEQAYRAHQREQTSLPHSTFLRFPDSARDRIIALPAFLGGEFNVAGMKWIASMPGNLELGLERASAVMILNARRTGRPEAILEASIISAQRTAASAAVAARELCQAPPPVIGLIGCGPIQYQICRFLAAVWPGAQSYLAFDLDPQRSARFGERLARLRPQLEYRAAASVQEVLAGSPLTSFATTAVEPHVDDLSMCPPSTTILHVSLRDLMPQVILSHDNMVDDVDHVCRANTSIHLASELAGHRDFVRCTLGQHLEGAAPAPNPAHRIHIFSPFGLGILDLAVARLVCQRATEAGLGLEIGGFLPTPWEQRAD